MVDSQFGSHILQVQRIRGPERMVRHILIATEPTPDDIETARERALEIHAAVSGGAALSEFYDEGEEIGLPHPMTLPRDRLGQLPSGLAQALDRAGEGEVLGPIEVEAQPGQPAYSVVRVEEVREAGVLTYEDVRDQIRGVLQTSGSRRELLNRLRTQIPRRRALVGEPKRLAVTVGDPRGIGPEILPAALRDFLADGRGIDILALGDAESLSRLPAECRRFPVGSFTGGLESAGSVSLRAIEEGVRLALGARWMRSSPARSPNPRFTQ